jgi:hypothetical protein
MLSGHEPTAEGVIFLHILLEVLEKDEKNIF